MSQLILPPQSAIYRKFSRLIADADLVFFAGLPAVGKSLLLQQLSLMALASGRRVTLLQWDVARQPFEKPRFPLSNGATHPLVIRATGLWLRGALVEWRARSQGADMLIGEVPLIGGRLMEIARHFEDEAETLLRDRRTQFLIPLPSRRVRAHIEARRAQTIARPQHENEAHDAPPDLLRALWRDLHQVAVQLDLAEPVEGEPPYSPEIYARVYRHLLRHRHCHALPINEPLKPTTSVYEQAAPLPFLRATEAQAEAVLSRLGATTPPAQAIADARRWYDL